MLKKIAHIGIAVKDLEATAKLYSDIFSLSAHGKETMSDLNAIFFKVGESEIELLQSTIADGLIAKYINKKGEGVHHIAYYIDNLEQALESLKDKGFELIDKVPRKGANNTRVAFLNPKSCYGVLIELIEDLNKTE